MPPVMFAVGDVISSYRIVRRIGSGTMGSVYEAEHVRLGVRYAIKVFTFEGRNADFHRKRFLAEGRILARLNHPRIVRVHDMDVADGFAWFAMDYVEGPDGRPQTLAEAPKAEEASEGRIRGWYEDVREALEAVHAAGIVHRDVKLENILIGRDGRAVLSDFGISRITDESLRKELEVTRTMVAGSQDVRMVMGTAAYLAPELISGGEPSAAADHYALGIAFFRLLTGLWYEPGPHALDLLSPFDRQWRTIVAGLLDPVPGRRRAQAFARPRRFPWRPLLWLLSVVGALAVGYLLAKCPHLEWVPEPEPEPEVDVGDVFSIPDSVR